MVVKVFKLKNLLKFAYPTVDKCGLLWYAYIIAHFFEIGLIIREKMPENSKNRRLPNIPPPYKVAGMQCAHTISSFYWLFACDFEKSQKRLFI